MLDALKSPALPAAILLYGIVYLFAGLYFVGAPWHRAYTIGLYAAVSLWAAFVAIDSFKRRRPGWNRIDLVFVLFLAYLLVSIAVNWWDGTAQYLKLMPALFLVPYVIGRTVNAGDCFSLRQILIFMGLLLIVALIPEYLLVFKYGLPYEDSPAPLLFGKNHGVMLSGLLLAATLASLVSVLLSPNNPGNWPLLSSRWGRFFGYMALMVVVVTMGWVSSRAGALAGIVGVGIVLMLAPKATGARKVAILLVLTLSLALAVTHSLQWKANSAHYAAVVRAPVLFGAAAADAKSVSGAAEWRGSILGNQACDHIVDSISERWIHYQQAVALFLAKPLFGAGANHYGFYACSRPGSFPHSTLLQVFAELGVLGGLLYCTLIWLTLGAFMQARIRSGAFPEQIIWSWFLAFSVMQILIAQLNGNYFVSAALNFVIGVAANARDVHKATVENA